MASPAARLRVGRSFNHSQAISAPNSGVAALKIDASPALIDKAA